MPDAFRTARTRCPVRFAPLAVPEEKAQRAAVLLLLRAVRLQTASP
jgi:hypothetical protein